MFNLDWREIILSLPWVLLALSFHEYCHAIVSYRLGDPTPQYDGRLSLNPLAHVDPIGFIALLLFRFGWAKPVQINPSYYKNPAKGTFLVSLAGPGANFALAIVLTLLIRGMVLPGTVDGVQRFVETMGLTLNIVLQFLYVGLAINLVLGVFNLLPIPPLDGSKILRYFLHGAAGRFYDNIEPYGFYILIVFIMVGGVSIINPILDYLLRFLLGPIL